MTLPFIGSAEVRGHPIISRFMCSNLALPHIHSLPAGVPHPVNRTSPRCLNGFAGGALLLHLHTEGAVGLLLSGFSHDERIIR